MSHQSDNRKEVTKGGHNYMTTHIRGWNKGIRIESTIKEDQEHFEIFETGGSNNPSNKNKIYETV
jgi:hypothetical protein